MEDIKEGFKTTFCIENPTNRSEKYLVYNGKRYLINFDLFVLNCNYFYTNQNKFKNIEMIPLLNDIAGEIQINDETIEAFIKSVENQLFEVNYSTIVHLHYLSKRYEYPQLTEITSDFISKHSEELVLKTIHFEHQIHKDTPIDTSKEEEIISKNLSKFINNEEMLNLPICIVERILKDGRYQISQDELNQFLFRMLDKHGKDASILFNNIDFGEERMIVFTKLINEYSERFDFNMINSTLAKTTIEMSKEMSKNKIEYENIFSKMIKSNEEEKKKLIEIQNENQIKLNLMRKELEEEKEKNKQELEKERNQLRKEIDEEKKTIIKLRLEEEEIINEMKKKQENMKNYFEEQMKKFQNEFNNMITKQEEITSTKRNQQYQRIIQETINFESIKELESETQNFIIQDIIESYNYKKEGTRKKKK